jgi:hypothetical protein
VGEKDKRRIYHGGTEEEGERIEQKGAKDAKLREEERESGAELSQDAKAQAALLQEDSEDYEDRG